MVLKVVILFIVKIVSELVLWFCYFVFSDEEEQKRTKRVIIFGEAMFALPIYGVLRAAKFKHPLLWTLLEYSPIWQAGYQAVAELVSEK